MPYPYYPLQYGALGGAVLTDEPHMPWWDINPGLQLYGVTLLYETCAVCLDDPEDPKAIGCTSWGVAFGGLRHARVWGDGQHIAVPPSDEFKKLLKPYISL